MTSITIAISRFIPPRRFASAGLVLALVVPVALAGCGLSSGSGNGADGPGGGDGGAPSSDSANVVLHAPAVHRPAAAVCSHDRLAGDSAAASDGSTCRTDVDCAAGLEGRCLAPPGRFPAKYCSYDTCFDDADCSGEQLCSCREAGTNRASFCAPGNCKVDADCGAAGYCSPSADPSATNQGTTGWWCHTAADACSDDADCGGTDPYPQKTCVYDPSLTHWTCSGEAVFAVP